MAISAGMQKYFWDIDPKKSRPKSHPTYFIKRILEIGDKRAFLWLATVFGIRKIKAVSKKVKLSPKSKTYWDILFANR